MRATLLFILCVSMLTGCVDTTDRGYYGGGGYYDPGYRGGYHGGQEDAYERRRRRIEANCNMNWQNCAAICNQMANAQQRAVCVANCNNALNQCKAQR
ncbi:MAG: hypothetical protein ACOZEN_09855 [Thermodesulfobacteriota bacterium]